MRILLLIPSSKFAKTVIRDVLYGCWCCGNRIGAGSVPPLTLLSVATVLKNDGHDVRLFDSTVQEMAPLELESEIRARDAVIVLTSTMTFLEDAGVLAGLKRINPALITVLFGTHPTFMPEHSLGSDGIDILVRREPEYIIRDVFRKIRDGLSWEQVRGIGFKGAEGVVVNDDYPYIENLDELPVPDRSILPKAGYYNPIIRRFPYTTAETSRGCPGKCSFCTAPYMYGGRLRCRSAGKVIEEIEYLLKLGYREIYFRDETWTTFRKRNLELLEKMIENSYDLSWICNARAGTVDRETLGLMKKAGCHLIKVGVESGSQRILDRSRKMVKLSEVEDIFRWAAEFGIDTHAHLMLGMPGEDRKSVDDTVAFIKKIRPTTIDVGICTPYPGTDLFKEVAAAYPEIKDGSCISFENLHVRSHLNEKFTALSGREIESLLRKIYRGFYFSPSYIFRRLMGLKDMRQLKRLFLSGIKVFLFALKGK